MTARRASALATTLMLLLAIAPIGSPAAAAEVIIPGSDTSIMAAERVCKRLNTALARGGFSLGSPLFIRVFKQSHELELWLLAADGTYQLFKTYIICHQGGDLGPKRAEGDNQSPEGFYRVTPAQMNPWSNYHLAFNLGYPNEYDQAYNRTGSALMIHGRCSSTGCFAMTDYYMDEIYTLAHAALAQGQPEFQVHIFPFRLTAENLAAQAGSPWLPFWQNLKEGYDLFEQHRLVPVVAVKDRRYVFTAVGQSPLAQLSGGTAGTALP